MTDVKFIASVNELFCGNQKADMQAENTAAGRASFFLDKVIGSSLEMYFEKLLNAMEAYEGAAGNLAIEIKKEILIG